jgi:hypothetical protein
MRAGDDPVDLRIAKAQREEVIAMNKARRGFLAAAILGSMATGGLLGATLLTPTTSSAATNSTATTAATSSTSASSSAAAPTAGTFKPNEDATHEKSESVAREAQENAGQVPTVP